MFLYLYSITVAILLCAVTLNDILIVSSFAQEADNNSGNNSANGNDTNTLLLQSIVPAIVAAIASVAAALFSVWNQTKLKKLEEQKAERDARREYEYEARKRLYRECEPILFQLQQFSEAANRRISHMPRRIEHFFSQDEYRIAKDSLQWSKEKSLSWQEISEAGLKTKLGWLSFPNYYMLSTIYHLLAPLATFKILQSRLTAVDLELDLRIKTMYILSKHLYSTFSADADFAEMIGINPYLYEQGIFAGYLDNATEELINDCKDPDRVPRIKSFGEFNEQYVMDQNSTGINEKMVKPPFDRIYNLLEFFHPREKRVLWRILIEQLYLYNAIKEVYQTKGDTKEKSDRPNYEDAIRPDQSKNKPMKPIKRLTDEQLKDFKAIPKDQLEGDDTMEKWFEHVIKHLREQPELKDLIDENASSVY
jgi:hypothetical protein